MALVVALIFLLVLSFLGLAAMQGSTLEERMANNLTDRNLAYQAAELTLRDAQRDLTGLLADGSTICPGGATKSINGKSVTCRGSSERATALTLTDQTDFWRWGDANMVQTWTPDCANGQCLSIDPSSKTPVWADANALWDDAGTYTIQYGKYTGATAIPGVAVQPRYVLEIFPADRSVYGTGGSERVVFRITARAVGQNPNSIVMLQAVSAP